MSGPGRAQPSSRGLPSQAPSRALKTVSRAATAGRVVAHVRGHRRPGSGDGGPEPDAARVLGGRPVAGRRAAAAVGRQGERLALPLLPGQFLAARQVEGGIDDEERADVGVLARGGRPVPQRVQRQVVVRVEPGDGVGVAGRREAVGRRPAARPGPRRPRRPEVAPHQPVGVHPVQREQVDVDAPARSHAANAAAPAEAGVKEAGDPPRPLDPHRPQDVARPVGRVEHPQVVGAVGGEGLLEQADGRQGGEDQQPQQEDRGGRPGRDLPQDGAPRPAAAPPVAGLRGGDADKDGPRPAGGELQDAARTPRPGSATAGRGRTPPSRPAPATGPRTGGRARRRSTATRAAPPRASASRPTCR